MMKQQMQIGELADRTGVSTRTIRYYIQEGLLPAPETQGKYTTYDEEYIYRLELIQLLKDAYLPLKEIRDKIAGLSLREVRELIEQMRASSGQEPMYGINAAFNMPPPGLILPAENLESEPPDWEVLERRTFERRIEPRPEADTEIEEDFIEPPALIRESRRMPSPKSVNEEDDAAAYLAKLRERQNLNRPAPAPRQQPMLYQEQAVDRMQGESWQRIEIAPGIELHVRQPLHQKDEFRLKKLIEFAKKLF